MDRRLSLDCRGSGGRYRFPAVLISTIACAAIGLAVWIEDVNWSALVILAGGAVIYWIGCQWAHYMRPGAPWAGHDEFPDDEDFF